jgi:tetratricopeptide (TPR) repeat protein
MRYLFLFFLVFSTVGDGLKKASRINAGVLQANKLYHQQKYDQAANIYRFLNDSLQVKDDELILNLAHATYQNGEEKSALKYYQRLRNNPNPAIQAAALNQMGLLAYEDANPEKALYYFKKAIVQNPMNDVARFNYELVQKYIAQNPFRKGNNPTRKNKAPVKNTENSPKSGQKSAETGPTDLLNDLNSTGGEAPQPKPQPNQNQNGLGAAKNLNQGEENQVAQGAAGGPDKGLDPEMNNQGPGNFGKSPEEALLQKEKNMQTLRQRLSKTDLTAEKATMLLEAMRQAELQYLQQLPRHPSRQPDKNKPDW